MASGRPFPFVPATMLAPMEGVGHPAFRALAASRGGVGVVCTEFVRVSRAPLSAVALRREVVKVPGLPLSVQVMGNDEDKMAEAAAVVSEAGADVVDINLGCPMPRVVRKGVGAAMLKDPPLLSRVLCAMRAATPGLLSAKIRAGFDEADHVLEIARRCEDAGVDYLVVHPRRRCDFYSGVADWRIVGTLVRALSIPVVGNGDVWYAADAPRMKRETGCAAVMLGRPVMRNPFLFAQIAALEAGETPMHPSGEDVVAHLHATRARYLEAYGDDRAILGKLKELVKYLVRAVPPDHAPPLRALLAHGEVDAMLGAVEATFLPLAAHQLDLDAHGAHRLEQSGSASLVEDAA